jgi:transposase
MMRKKGIRNPRASGDGTGYSLTITRHYRSEREKELKAGKKDGSRRKTGRTKKAFVHAFALMDLDTRMYVGYGTSIMSEKDAFRKAMSMAGDAGISPQSVRLDKYYSHKSIVEHFGRDTVIYLIPKKNATIKGPAGWKRIARSYVNDPFNHMHEYYKRNNSESGFSSDKRSNGWKVWQKKDDRIDTALLCKGLWHNLLLMG